MLLGEPSGNDYIVYPVFHCQDAMILLQILQSLKPIPVWLQRRWDACDCTLHNSNSPFG